MGLLDDLKVQYRMGGITQRLIFWNIGIFLISLFFYEFRLGVFIFPDWLALSSDPLTVAIHPWTLISYAFLHSGFLHLLFNMLVLNYSGMLFLTFFKEKQLVGLYILSAVFSGIVFSTAYFLMGQQSTIVGASAAIMAVLMATTTYSPKMPIRLLLIGRVQLWHMTAVILIIDLMQLMIENTGGHISHLAGAFFGFIYIKMLQNGTDLSKIITGISDWVVNISKPSNPKPFKKVHRNYNTKQNPTASKLIGRDKKQQQIDDILDKISRSGYESLTQEEKDFLFNAGK
ncbi:rhomboid family intramembrane serine protease [Flavobacterium pallidum]|uniref:Rhomboid family intramembrane serine protease n=1 Tax=Flavobacterium pallidum TaxID=2172098 RepID=A0A2S1SHM1_9FLAO|nr:rhomboid family intramembrane serine protease [Flavobacterium pallidum]AWI25847.1 rhomboid family intramembrane serine protease [Flavobacterium pallidum]